MAAGMTNRLRLEAEWAQVSSEVAAAVAQVNSLTTTASATPLGVRRRGTGAPLPQATSSSMRPWNARTSSLCGVPEVGPVACADLEAGTPKPSSRRAGSRSPRRTISSLVSTHHEPASHAFAFDKGVALPLAATRDSSMVTSAGSQRRPTSASTCSLARESSPIASTCEPVRAGSPVFAFDRSTIDRCSASPSARGRQRTLAMPSISKRGTSPQSSARSPIRSPSPVASSRAPKGQTSDLHSPRDFEGCRTMFDKRLLRRGYRDRYMTHLGQWRVQHCPEPSTPRSDVSTNSGSASAGSTGDSSSSLDASNVRVCVRKRPLFEHEQQEEEFDVLSVRSDELVVHNCLTKPDLASLFVHHSGFRFSEVFDEDATNDVVYSQSAQPAVRHVLNSGVATIFMFGQTGSGKTYTMNGLIQRASAELFSGSEETSITLAAFEIAGQSLRDLVASPGSQNGLKIMQDDHQRTRVVGLCEREVASQEELLSLIRQAMQARKTRGTQVHDSSSRAHLVLRVTLTGPRFAGSGSMPILTLVDLAGTERKEDSSHHDEQTRRDTAEINTSLFALKSCFRALRMPARCQQQAPFRESFLTRVLADSFTDERAQVLAFGTVSPSASDTEHTLSTLHALQQLQGSSQLSFESKQDLAGAPPKPKVQHPKTWTEEEVRMYLSKAAGGRAKGFITRSLPRGTNGSNFIRWNCIRFVHLCDGDAALGERIYKELRQRVQASG